MVGFIESSEFELVESLTERIADIVINEFNVPWVRVTLHKPGALSATKDVGLIIERGTPS